jgi:thiol:disulfide interchange protein DsbG
MFRFAVAVAALFLASLVPLQAAEHPPARATAGYRQQAAASILKDIQQATWVRDGKSAHVMYVFFDPNCFYCHRVYETLRPAVQRGEIELRWIPTATLTTTSLGKAAAILEAKNPTDAFYQNESGYSTETGSLGGISEEPLPRNKTLQDLDRNLKLLQRSGSEGVPALLFRARDGSTNLIVGAPPPVQLEKLLKDIE